MVDLLNGMATRFQTAWVIGLTVFLWILWDIYMFKTTDRGDTISEVTLRSSIKHPMIPFLIGVLMGHFFWPQIVYVVESAVK